MMIKVDNEFLEFDELIEVEKQIKLFEEISTTDGDFSYSFDIDKTSTNRRLLQYPEPDNISKLTYQKIPANLLSDSGAEIFKGYLRIERITERYHCSFFAGNNNWFGMLSGNMRDIDWSEFDLPQTEVGIAGAIFNTSGTVFPLVDNGLLAYRGAPVLKVEDFVGAIYLREVVNKVFSVHGIKVQGELTTDADYNTAIVLSNGKSQSDIDSRSTKAHTSSSANPDDDTYHKMTWDNDSDYPYFDGSANLFDLSLGRYTADVKMKVKVSLNISQALLTVGSIAPFYMAFYVNGVLFSEKLGPFADSYSQSFEDVIVLEAGDYLEVFTRNNALAWDDPIEDATLEITPIFIYKAIGSAMVPDWTQAEFISKVFERFCVLPSYDAANMILTVDLFEKIKAKPSVDLSEYISEVESDYTEFISSYGKKSILSYEETDEEEDFRKLNLDRRAYNTGVIEVDNEFLEDEVEVIQSKFAAPITYLNPIFSMSQEKTNLLEYDEEINIDFTSVIDSPLTPGRARFAIPEDVFELSDMVRVTDSTDPTYNGDFIVATLGAGYIELEGLSFGLDAIGKLGKQNFVYSSSEQVYLLHHVPLYSIIKFSTLLSFQLEGTDYQTLAPAFYNPIRTNRPFDSDFPFSMAFEPGDQTSVTERYFRLLSKVLNDPVKLLCVAHLPYDVYYSLDFLRPIKILTEQTQNMYYLNRIRGYKGPEYPCELELIKI